MGGKREATIDDLYHVEGKAEIVNGELVLMPLSSGLHGFDSLAAAASLLDYARRTKRGHAFGDGVGFIVNLPNRRSFSPDAAFATQPVMPVDELDARRNSLLSPPNRTRLTRNRFACPFFCAASKSDLT